MALRDAAAAPAPAGRSLGTEPRSPKAVTKQSHEQPGLISQLIHPRSLSAALSYRPSPNCHQCKGFGGKGGNHSVLRDYDIPQVKELEKQPHPRPRRPRRHPWALCLCSSQDVTNPSPACSPTAVLFISAGVPAAKEPLSTSHLQHTHIHLPPLCMCINIHT